MFKSILKLIYKFNRTLKGSILVSFLFFVVSQISRLFFLRLESVYLGFIGITHFKNDKFAFSLPIPDLFIYLIYLVIAVIVALYIVLKGKKFDQVDRFAWVLVISGAISNIFERLLFGYVYDYIRIFNGVFNFADGCIIIGLIILLFRNKNK